MTFALARPTQIEAPGFVPAAVRPTPLISLTLASTTALIQAGAVAGWGRYVPGIPVLGALGVSVKPRVSRRWFPRLERNRA